LKREDRKWQTIPKLDELHGETPFFAQKQPKTRKLTFPLDKIAKNFYIIY
jgi:hypothetical protein